MCTTYNFFCSILLKKLIYERGKSLPIFKISILCLILFTTIFSLIGNTDLQLQQAELIQNFGIFNYVGGVKLVPEFLALLFALSLYTSTFIAENVRAGILSVGKGQKEASKSLGFNNSQSLKLIIIPQALRVIIPPTTNQYLNLLKNSSLAAGIGYPDLASVFAGTALSQTGKAIEIIFIVMLTYLSISLIISAFLNWYNHKIAFIENNMIINFIQWSKKSLFSNWWNSLITLFCIYLLFLIIPPFINWAILDATFSGKLKTDCTAGGACWVFIRVWFEKLMYGFYPVENIWRINLSFIIFIGTIGLSFFVREKYKLYILFFNFYFSFYCIYSNSRRFRTDYC